MRERRGLISIFCLGRPAGGTRPYLPPSVPFSDGGKKDGKVLVLFIYYRDLLRLMIWVFIHSFILCKLE